MGATSVLGAFEWDEEKERINVSKHGINFLVASGAFLDPDRMIAVDELHSRTEPRQFCIGKVADRVLTVRFTYRRSRILGAGTWKKGMALHEKENTRNR